MADKLFLPEKEKKRNDGKKAEEKVQDALKLLEAKHTSTWVRLYDSTSAGFGSGGNLIPEQPGDYIVLLNGRTSLLEVKSSSVHDSLLNASLHGVFSENQILGARLWARAGALPLCYFYSLELKQFELWWMQPIVDAYLKPPRKRQLNAVPMGFASSKEDIAGLLLKYIR